MKNEECDVPFCAFENCQHGSRVTTAPIPWVRAADTYARVVGGLEPMALAGVNVGVDVESTREPSAVIIKMLASYSPAEIHAMLTIAHSDTHWEWRQQPKGAILYYSEIYEPSSFEGQTYENPRPLLVTKSQGEALERFLGPRDIELGAHENPPRAVAAGIQYLAEQAQERSFIVIAQKKLFAAVLPHIGQAGLERVAAMTYAPPPVPQMDLIDDVGLAKRETGIDADLHMVVAVGKPNAGGYTLPEFYPHLFMGVLGQIPIGGGPLAVSTYLFRDDVSNPSAGQEIAALRAAFDLARLLEKNVSTKSCMFVHEGMPFPLDERRRDELLGVAVETPVARLRCPQCFPQFRTYYNPDETKCWRGCAAAPVAE